MSLYAQHVFEFKNKILNSLKLYQTIKNKSNHV